MYTIKKQNIESCEKLYISNSLWGTDNYKPEVYAQIAYDDTGFVIKFTVFEENPRREAKKHLDLVHFDSCIEWFVNFAPEKCDRYFNFEINANGVMNAAFRKNRAESESLTVDEIELFGIKTEIKDGFWTGTYKIPFSYLESKVNGFSMHSGLKIKTNLYKCGEATEFVHFMSYFPIALKDPEFHCPQFFGEMIVE